MRYLLLLLSLYPVTLEAANSGSPVKAAGLHWFDWSVLGIYLAGVLGLGWFYSLRQKSTDEYFTGGGNMNSLLIGVSYFATLLSTITYLAGPGEIIKNGPVAVVAGVLAYPICYFVVGYWLVPALMKRHLKSAYELLENNLGVGIRLFGAGMFIVLRLVWMSLLLYVASKALVVVMGFSPEATPWVAASAGMIAVIYSSTGGLRAVVITDFLQTCLLLLGALITICIVTIDFGGLSWWPTTWNPNWAPQPFFSFDPHVRVTIVGTIIHVVVWSVCTAGGDQTAIQRFMSTKSAQDARHAYLINALLGIFKSGLLAVLGLSLLAFFMANPEYLPEGISPTEDADSVFPYFISSFLPAGIAGLVVAAVFAAAMSSIDSGVNSITAVVTTDFLDRFGLKPESETAHTRLAMGLAFGIGVIAVTCSTFMGHVPGNFLAVTSKTTNLLVAPIFSLFFMALFVSFATPLGTYFGAMVGIVVGTLIGFWDVLTGRPPISFQWIGICSLVVNLVVSCLVSYAGPRRGHRGTVIIGMVSTGLLLAVFFLVVVSCSIA